MIQFVQSTATLPAESAPDNAKANRPGCCPFAAPEEDPTLPLDVLA